MAMDWANERYVRLYTRDTVTWKLLSWQARTVLLHLFRKVDRAGVLDVGADGIAGVVAMLELPEEIVSVGLAQLVQRKTVEDNDDAYYLPKFIEAQEAPSSDKQRAKDSRERRRDIEVAKSRGILETDKASQNVTEESQNERNRHAASHGVTPRHSDNTQQDTTKDPSSAEADGALVLFAQQPAEPDAAMKLATTCCEALREHAGKTYRPESIATVEPARKLAKKRVTPEQVRTVVERMSAKWRGDPKMEEYLRPSTLLAPGKFFGYLDDAAAGKTPPVAVADTFSQRRRLGS